MGGENACNTYTIVWRRHAVGSRARRSRAAAAYAELPLVLFLPELTEELLSRQQEGLRFRLVRVRQEQLRAEDLLPVCVGGGGRSSVCTSANHSQITRQSVPITRQSVPITRQSARRITTHSSPAQSKCTSAAHSKCTRAAHCLCACGMCRSQRVLDPQLDTHATGRKALTRLNPPKCKPKPKTKPQAQRKIPTHTPELRGLCGAPHGQYGLAGSGARRQTYAARETASRLTCAGQAG